MGGHPDSEIRTGPSLINFFWPFGPQFVLKIRGVGIPGCSRGLTTDINEYRDIFLAPVIQKVDGAIHGINLFPVDSAVGFPNTYPLDSTIQLWNN